MTVIPLPRFHPDRSRFGPQASGYVLNARVTADGWGPIKDLLALSDPLPEAFRGGIAVRTDAGTWKIFVGCPTNIYRINTSTYAWEEVSRLTNDYNLGDGVFWDYDVFGNRLIFTAAGSDFPQYVDLDTADDFANLPNASFEAEKIWISGDFVNFGRIDGNDREIYWSGVSNSEHWTIGERGCDRQVLPDGGRIMKGIRQNLNSLIIQEECIRRQTFTGHGTSPFVFDILNPETGSVASRSVVNIGPDDFVYLRSDGWFRGISARPIGVNKIDRWFFSQVDQSLLDLVSGQADPFEKIIWYRYPISLSANKMVGYHWQLDEWFPADIDAVGLLSAATPGYSLEEIAALYPGGLETIPYSLDSRFFKGGVRGFAGINSSGEFGFFDGDNLEAIVETPDLLLNHPRRAEISRVMGLVDTSDFQIAVAPREVADDAVTYSDYAGPESGTHWVSHLVSGRMFRFRLKMTAGAVWENAVGIEPVYSDGGMW